MTTLAPFSLQAVPSSRPGVAVESWGDLDAELARWLRMRTALRAKRVREDSSLDGMAMALRRVRVSLEAMGDSAASVASGERDPRLTTLVSRGYRWAIRIARELDTIEQLDLDAVQEWTRFEALAPFAQAFFESALAGPFAAVPRTMDVARLERDIDAVMAPISIALMSSAWAA
ncbi:hypothetical protein BH11MYX4_BH11MYX4_27610 [soil metagenome]